MCADHRRMEAAVRQRAALTRAQAQRVQNAARAAGRWMMWFVTTSDPDRPGKPAPEKIKAWARQRKSVEIFYTTDGR
jgi:hypothetical protein